MKQVTVASCCSFSKQCGLTRQSTGPARKAAQAAHFYVDAVEKPLSSQIINTKKRRGFFHAVFNFCFVVGTPFRLDSLIKSWCRLGGVLRAICPAPTAHTRDAPAFRCYVPGSRASTAHRPCFAL